MAALNEIRPFIRVAHYYQFSSIPAERHRLGYCYALHLFNSGRGQVTILGRTFPVGRGTLVFIPPSQRHSFYTDTEELLGSYNVYCDLWAGSNLDAGAHLIWEPNQLELDHVTHVASCEELESLPYVIQLQTEPFLMEQFARLVQMHSSSNLYSSEISCGLLYTFILELSNLNREEHLFDYRIRKLLTYMEEHPESKPNFDDWMRRCELRKTQFYALFKAVTGMSPGAYSLRIRMRWAAAILLESNQSVTKVAEQLGYSSIHYFSQQFKEYFGCSPTSYRNHRKA